MSNRTVQRAAVVAKKVGHLLVATVDAMVPPHVAGRASWLWARTVR